SIGLILGAALVIGASAAKADGFTVNGFETYPPGSVVGQSFSGGGPLGPPPFWTKDATPAQPDPVILPDPTLQGHGLVLEVSPTGGTTNNYTGAYVSFGDLVAAGNSMINI